MVQLVSQINFDTDELSAKSVKISRALLLFLIDLLVIDLVIISTLTICNKITPCPG
jgi:hypothetical protein